MQHGHMNVKYKRLLYCNVVSLIKLCAFAGSICNNWVLTFLIYVFVFRSHFISVRSSSWSTNKCFELFQYCKLLDKTYADISKFEFISNIYRFQDFS
jgi:hypothetical protein